MRKILLIILLVILPLSFVVAQTATSKDNNFGFWNDQATWQQTWAGINNTNPLPQAKISIYGYVVHGTPTGNTSILVENSPNVLAVFDTLRIYGTLSISNGAKLVVETGGVLIVHGTYNQYGTASSELRGTMIVTSDFHITNSTLPVMGSAGRLYVGSAAYRDGVAFSTKNLHNLKTEDPHTHNFATTNVVSINCSSVNSGTLSFAGGVSSSVLWWESSTDYFKTVQVISSTSKQLTYKDLTRTTSYRVWYNKGNGELEYSNIAAVLVNKATNGGAVSGAQSEFCGTLASVSVSVSGHTGTIVRWEHSTNNFATAPQTTVSSNSSVTLTNLTATTQVRAVVKSTSCAETYSSTFVIRKSEPSAGGTIQGPATVCKGTNSFQLLLQGMTGSVVRWEVSNDGFVADIRTITNTTDKQAVTNISATTWYRAVVKNGSCAAVNSAAIRINVVELLSGSTSSTTTRVCTGSNTGTIQLQNHNGTIARWEWSNDGFVNHKASIAFAQSPYTFNNITADTWFRAIVRNTECGELPSTAYVVRVDALSVGGTISGTSSVCPKPNSGTLTLAGHLGSILMWETSNDNFVANLQTHAITTAGVNFKHLTESTWFRTVVKNGECSVVRSPSFKVTVGGGADGTITGPATVCVEGNSAKIVLSNYTGTIKRWEWSNDNFTNNLESSAHTGAEFTIYNLKAITYVRVVLENSGCGEAFSNIHTITYEAPANSGYITGPAVVCSGSNSGFMQLGNFCRG